MNLKPQTLMVAIQCVAARTRELDAQLQNDDPQNAAELEQLLVGYDLAADDLKNAYEQALGQYSGLPPYDRLIEDRCPDGPWAGRRWPARSSAQRNDRWSSAGTATPSPATPQCAATSATPRTYGASASAARRRLPLRSCLHGLDWRRRGKIPG